VLSVNECRNSVLLEDVEGGDELRAPVNTIALSAWQDWLPRSGGAEPAAPTNNTARIARMIEARQRRPVAVRGPLAKLLDPEEAA